MGAGLCRAGWDGLSQELPGVGYAFFSPEMPLVGSTQLLPQRLEELLQSSCLWTSSLPLGDLPSDPGPQREGGEGLRVGSQCIRWIEGSTAGVSSSP